MGCVESKEHDYIQDNINQETAHKEDKNNLLVHTTHEAILRELSKRHIKATPLQLVLALSTSKPEDSSGTNTSESDDSSGTTNSKLGGCTGTSTARPEVSSGTRTSKPGGSSGRATSTSGGSTKT